MKTKKLSRKEQIKLAVKRAVSQQAWTDAADSVDGVMVIFEQESPWYGSKREPGKKRKSAKKS
jgi:hypothetical protein